MAAETDGRNANMQETRAALRKIMLGRRRELLPEVRDKASILAQGFLLESKIWREARIVLLYCATRNEIDTMLLLSAALRDGKTLLLPKCDSEQPGVMRAVHCPALECLVPGKFGILEPVEQTHGNLLASPVPDLVVLPGVVFDRSGGRLGYGGGYYDRFVAKLVSSPALVGLAYAFQVVETLPLEPWDMRVHAVCLDTGLFACPLSGDTVINLCGGTA